MAFCVRNETRILLYMHVSVTQTACILQNYVSLSVVIMF